MLSQNNYELSTYRDTLLNYANSIINKYNAKEISSLEEAKNTFNIWVYMSKKEIVKDINYETILDDILLYIDEDIQKRKSKERKHNDKTTNDMGCKIC